MTNKRQRIPIGVATVILLLAVAFPEPAESTPITEYCPIAKRGEHWPVFDDLNTPLPAGHRQYAAGEFRIDPNRVDRYADELLFGGRKELRRLAEFYANNPGGQELFEQLRRIAAARLSEWSLKTTRSDHNRYVLQIQRLSGLVIVYALTGHQMLGRFIHDHIMQTVRLPMEFWLHAELRGYNRQRPLASLETASTASIVVIAVSYARDLFSYQELTEIDTALRAKTQQPFHNFISGQLQLASVNNWLAVVSTGAYLTAKHLHDADALALAQKGLKHFLDRSIEQDGSYGEGSGYFSYPMSKIIQAFCAMPPDERRRFLSSTPLVHSSTWLAYPYLYDRDSSGKPRSTRLHFGDNSYWGAPAPQLMAMLATVMDDPLAEYLGAFFDPNPAWRMRDWIFAMTALSTPKPTVPQSPGEMKLPLVRAFDNGEGFIRSSWQPGATILSLYAAGPTRTNYSHQRPERNALTLAADDEYLLISCGSASYRSDIHYKYDLTTKAANTITLDDRGQRFPRSQKTSWGEFAPADVVNGRPAAKIILARSGENTDILVGEAKACYDAKLTCARRAVVFKRAHRYVLVIDRIAATDKPHTFTSYWHFNNQDGKGRLSGSGTSWRFTRPKADLKIDVLADFPLIGVTSDGYMHGIGRDVSPGGTYEGKPGSARTLSFHNPQPTKSYTAITVFQPLPKGQPPLPVHRERDTIRVGNDHYRLEQGKLYAGPDVFALWK